MPSEKRHHIYFAYLYYRQSKRIHLSHAGRILIFTFFDVGIDGFRLDLEMEFIVLFNSTYYD